MFRLTPTSCKPLSSITLATNKNNGIFQKTGRYFVWNTKEYAVKDLGIFHSKVCDWWQNEHYNWWSTIQLPLYSTETVIWIEGDAQAPLSQHIWDLQVLLKN